jgi:two-component system, NarL family, sensor histidine kinase BarA
LVNYFRQLTLPWLVALVLMLLFTGLWYQSETKTQQRIQMEQVSASIQLSIVPLLKNKDTDLFKAQLNHLRFTSVLPLNSIAIFNHKHALIVASEIPDELRNYKPQEPVTHFSVQPYHNMQLVLQPLFNTDSAGNIAALPHLDDRSYMLLLFEPETSHTVWLVPVAIVALLGGAVLIVWQNALIQQSQRQHTDVSLLTHKLSQLQHGQLNVRINEELVSELVPLKQAVNDLAQHKTDAVQRSAELYQQLEEKAAQAQQQSHSLQQQMSLLKQQHTELQQGAQNRLLNLQQIYKLQPELSEDEFIQALSSQLCLMQLQMETGDNITLDLSLTEFVAAQIELIKARLAEKNIELQLFESKENAGCVPAISAGRLSALLTAMVQLGSRSEGVSEMTLRVKADHGGAAGTLFISISSNGNGISLPVRQLLNSNEMPSLPWYESDISTVLLLKRQLNANLAVRSLDGLGCTIEFNMPLPLTTDSPARIPHLLLFDNQIANLTERAQNVASLAENVVKCSDLAELTMKSNQYAYDITLIMLPEPAELSKWRDLLQNLTKRSQVLCYAASGQVAMWSEALQLDVHTTPFCLAHLRAAKRAEAEHPSLLVVDDNPTNIAFVQVLLKAQPVKLYTASCGLDALKLCRQQHIDVILLDIQLPDIAGTEVARQLRQLADYQHTPILAFTAHALDDEVKAFRQAGMNDVIFKPLEVAKLEQILRWCSVGKADDINQ